jgi:hypothetical protein
VDKDKDWVVVEVEVEVVEVVDRVDAVDQVVDMVLDVDQPLVFL